VIDQNGFVRGHAYTVVDAREVHGHRLVKIRWVLVAFVANTALTVPRNPWSETEWNGAWSDGSKEWTWEIMKELGT